MTDNDIGFANFARFLRPFVNGSRWERAADRQRVSKREEYTDEQGAYHLHVKWKHPLCRKLSTDYAIFPDGKLLISLTVRSKIIEPVRVGIQIVLDESFDEVEWLGRGPHESYPDRKSSARIGLYQSTVNELGHHYLRPQENGARCDVSRLVLKSRNGEKITVTEAEGADFIFSARHYSQETLSRATHIHKLASEAVTVLSLDSAMCGVGGDLPGIASLHEAYRLRGNADYTANFLCSFSTDDRHPGW